MHKIQLEEDCTPTIENQHRLNPPIQEVVKKKTIKCLDTRVVYPISDSKWIWIAPEEQEKMAFTCPYGTFPFKRMFFGLCNTPATFQRCIISIFLEMVQDTLEVFMDDLFVVGNSYDLCLENLSMALKRCVEFNLVLKWEKYHFMVKKGIVLGDTAKEIEVDRAKVEVIDKLPPPILVKEVCSFLGHPGFYWRFIKDFSKVANPLCKFLEKKVKFSFDDDCLKAFECLKKKLIEAPIIFVPDWSKPFEIMSLMYLMAKKDVKSRMIRWVLLLQEFNFEVKDKKGYVNQVANYLSRMKKVDVLCILEACHTSPVRGHPVGDRTVRKVLQSSYYYPTLFKDADKFVLKYDQYQRLKMFPSKLKSRWSGPFRVSQVYSSGVVELENEDGNTFKALHGRQPMIPVLDLLQWKSRGKRTNNDGSKRVEI
ncbi:hypothetical protein FXO38_21483 [Capsicum annuum]|nr:hypothetical protein FXO38_21483 [Capsicum annuum]